MWWKPKPKHKVKIEKEDPINIICDRCKYFQPRIWADMQDGKWICHDCQDKNENQKVQHKGKELARSQDIP